LGIASGFLSERFNDPARDFAISAAETFDTRSAGVAFAYTPAFPGYTMMVLPPDILEQMLAESESSARAAVERFDAAATRSLVSAERRSRGRCFSPAVRSL
jgi:hypothetical protein